MSSLVNMSSDPTIVDKKAMAASILRQSVPAKPAQPTKRDTVRTAASTLAKVIDK